MNKETIDFHQMRADFYWWMSTLFARELSEQDIKEHQSEGMERYYAELASTPALQPQVDAFREAVNRAANREEAQLELAADYCELFLGAAKSGALPYASVYLCKDQLLNGAPAKEMDAWLERYGVKKQEAIVEPSDHLAIILDFLGNLIVADGDDAPDADENLEARLAVQAEFIDTQLMSWLPVFSYTLNEKDKFGFYRNAAALLQAFVKLDQSYLKGK